MAVAPASAARGPASYGGSGQRWALTTPTGERNPRPSTARPAAAQPSFPQTATTSPGRAPERVTGLAVAEVAERGDADHELVGADHVAAGDAHAGALGLGPHAVGEAR